VLIILIQLLLLLLLLALQSALLQYLAHVTDDRRPDAHMHSFLIVIIIVIIIAVGIFLFVIVVIVIVNAVLLPRLLGFRSIRSNDETHPALVAAVVP
jgi:uncharacterized membrane protein YdbT with pleckstrin-like domain